MKINNPGKYLPCALVALNILLGGCLCVMVALLAALGMPLPLPQALPVGVLFDDAFSSEKTSAGNGWAFLDAQNAQVRWSPGKLTQVIKTKNYNYMSSAGSPMRDLAVEVDAQPSNDPQTIIAVYGIVFARDANSNDSYRFGVTTGGSYCLTKIVNSKVVEPYIVELTWSPLLNPRPASNRLGVIVEGSTISLYINGSLVKAVIDNSITDGEFGVFTDSLWSDHAEVSFSRVRVLSVERAKLEWGTRFAGDPSPLNGILFNDEFASEQASTDKGWLFNSKSDSDLLRTANGYTFSVKKPNLRNSSLLPGQYKDFGVEIEAQPLNESIAWYGIVFRAHSEGGLPSDEYRFGLYPSHGELLYFLVKDVGGKTPNPWPVNVTPSRFINPSGKNRLGVLADGPIISLYINGQLVRTVTDESLASGQVGVFVQSIDSDSTQVAFSRVSVYTAGKAKSEWGAPVVSPGVLYDGDFASKQETEDEGWDYTPQEGTELVWSPNKLSMLTTTKGQFNGPYYYSHKDFGIEIEALPEDKPEIEYGIYFREGRNEDGTSLYAFGVTPSGRYLLFKKINGKVVQPYLVDVALSPYINKGASKNRLGVLAEGEKISLYVNGNLIKTVTDDTLTYGYAGVYALPGGSDQGKVDFNRMTVYSVDMAKKLWGDPSNVAALPPGVLFEDDFGSQKASTDKGWIFENVDTEQVAWSPNLLTVALKKQYIDDVIPIWSVFDNYGMEIEARSEDKPDSCYGIGFRAGDSGAGIGYYNFYVTTQGTYALLKRMNGKWSEKDLVPLTASPFINKGALKNRLGVLADGPLVSLYINGYLVRTVKDDSLTRGNVGMAVSNGRSDRAEFYLSRVTIYTVDKAKSELGRK